MFAGLTVDAKNRIAVGLTIGTGAFYTAFIVRVLKLSGLGQVWGKK